MIIKTCSCKKEYEFNDLLKLDYLGCESNLHHFNCDCQTTFTINDKQFNDSQKQIIKSLKSKSIYRDIFDDIFGGYK